MKTNELTRAALDWAVAKITNPEWTDEDRWYNTIGYVDTGDIDDEPYAPSTDWAQGGPIIEREKMDIACWDAHSMPWKASIDGDTDAGIALYVEYGPTPLIAAMRCYVASKLGDDINIPEELK
jgi:hypothetical protein